MSDFTMSNDVRCSICFAFTSEKRGDSFVTTPCGHVFHNQCMTCWLAKVADHPGCPVCRAKVKSENLVKLYGVLPVKRKLSNLKFVLIGDSGTGKTSLLLQYAKGVFSPENNSTVGCDLYFKNLEVGGHLITLNIWDTSGQDKYDAITPNYMRKSDGILCVYDVTNPSSLDNLHKWLKLANDCAPSGVPVMLVGNKVDLNDDRRVESNLGQAVADGLEINFLETSAKDAHNVEAAFRTLTAAALEHLQSNGKLDFTESEGLRLAHAATNYTGRRSKCGC